MSSEIHNTMVQTMELFSSNHSKTGEEIVKQTNSPQFFPCGRGLSAAVGSTVGSLHLLRNGDLRNCNQRDGRGTY